MNNLEKLIQEKCPNGVEYKTIGELCDVYTGGEPPEDLIKGKKPEGEYVYPIYSNGIDENALYGYSKEYRINEKAITFSSIGTIGHPTLREANFTPIIRLKVIIPKDHGVLNIDYLKYALEIVEFKKNKSSLPNVNAKMIKDIRVAIPPIEVQKEIVRILDNFTNLTAELTAELTARQKQYEYYRNKLLSFDESAESLDTLHTHTHTHTDTSTDKK